MFLIRFRKKISFTAPIIRQFCISSTHTPSKIQSSPTKIEDPTEKYYAKDNVELFMNILDIPNRTKARTLLQKHLHLLDLDQRDVIRSFFFLRQQLGLSIDDIHARPRILAQNALTLHNHSQVLSECGFTKIDMLTLLRFQLLMNRPVRLIKMHGFIPDDVDVPARLADYFEVTLRPADQQRGDVQLKVLRQMVIDTFFRQYFGFDDAELRRLWLVYPTIRHKSYQSTWRTIRLLEEEFGFSRDRIKFNGYLLFADPDNLEAILALGKLGGMDIRTLVAKRPKICMNTCETLVQIEQHLRDFGIGDLAISKCIEVYTLGSQTVFERLRELKRVKEFEVLVHHPRILRLVYFQIKARSRLEYLKQLKVKCMSLHVLSTSLPQFERYAREGIDRTKGVDVVLFLSRAFAKPDDNIRATISRHPHWCHVPLLSVKQTLDDLRKRKYDVNSIYLNIHLLLYPIDRIDEKIKLLNSPETNNLKVDTSHLSELQQLRMCLYLIEREFHFTGDGIWLEPVQHSETAFAKMTPLFDGNISTNNVCSSNLYKYGRILKKMETKMPSLAIENKNNVTRDLNRIVEIKM